MNRWVIFEDPRGAALRPLTLLRPASGLLLGAETGEMRWRRLTREEPVTIVCSDLLSTLAPGRTGWSGLTEDLLADTALWVSDLLLPDAASIAALRELEPDAVASGPAGPAAFRTGPAARRRLAEVVAAPEPGGTPADAVRSFLAQAPANGARVGGLWLGGLGDLLRAQEPLIAEDLGRLVEEAAGRADIPVSRDRNVAERAEIQGRSGIHGRSGAGDGFAYAPERILLGSGCRIDAGAVLDAREGPIVLEEGCEVFPHTWLRGPLFAGKGTRFLGGKVGSSSSFGPNCRIRGEVEATVVLGFSNKAHDGFVGHSYVGEWVNLGALTTTSDLKNNYSPISLERDGRRENTGLTKVGVFLGDHVKTRIGCLLTCGTVVGLGSTLIGDPAVTSRWIDDFCWGENGDEYEINKFLQTAETVLGRRGVLLGPEMERALRTRYQEAQELRRMRLAPRQEAGGI